MNGTIEAKDQALYDLVPQDAVPERVAGGFGFTEGPVWRGDSLLFSDLRNNRIVRWRQLKEGPEITTFSRGHSNGLTVDSEGVLFAAEHGGRRISRVDADGTRVALVERYQGLRFNSPNDIVAKSDGSL